MPIAVLLKQRLKDAGISNRSLASEIGISEVNLSRISTGRIKAIRFSTLEGLCASTGLQPADFFVYVPPSKIDDEEYLRSCGLDPNHLALYIPPEKDEDSPI